MIIFVLLLQEAQCHQRPIFIFLNHSGLSYGGRLSHPIYCPMTTGTFCDFATKRTKNNSHKTDILKISTLIIIA